MTRIIATVDGPHEPANYGARDGPIITCDIRVAPFAGMDYRKPKVGS